jgi:membrane associated rhomboid family serine protease
VAARTRILAFGAAGLLMIAGVLCAGLVGGLTGQVLAIALISAGLGGALLLMFLDVGLSEDRQRARDEERRRRRRS